MSARRKEKAVSLLSRIVSEFIEKLNFGKIIVTVTRFEISDDLRFAKIFISAYPPASENQALALVNKKSREIRNHIGAKIRWKFLPELSFLIDEGEKRRQRIEKILKGNTAW